MIKSVIPRINILIAIVYQSFSLKDNGSATSDKPTGTCITTTIIT